MSDHFPVVNKCVVIRSVLGDVLPADTGVQTGRAPGPGGIVGRHRGRLVDVAGRVDGQCHGDRAGGLDCLDCLPRVVSVHCKHARHPHLHLSGVLPPLGPQADGGGRGGEAAEEAEGDPGPGLDRVY